VRNRASHPSLPHPPQCQRTRADHPGLRPSQASAPDTSYPRRTAGRRAVITGPSCRWRRREPVFVHQAEEWPQQRKAVPVAPRGAPGPILQDRNMALTWSIGAPGRIRTRDPLLRRCRASVRGSRSPGQTACVSPVLGHQVQARWCRMRVSGGAGAPLDPRTLDQAFPLVSLSPMGERSVRRCADCPRRGITCGPQVVPSTEQLAMSVAGYACRSPAPRCEL
jgi:hypothetical protein